MEKGSLQRSLRVLTVAVLGCVGLTFAGGQTFAQQATPKWKAPIATITVRATPIPMQTLREIQRLTVQGHKFLAISASIPVPYGDLNLTQESGAAELGRRIRLAARMACQQLDIKYPPYIYAVIGTDDCAKKATDNGMAEADTVIEAAKQG